MKCRVLSFQCYCFQIGVFWSFYFKTGLSNLFDPQAKSWKHCVPFFFLYSPKTFGNSNESQLMNNDKIEKSYLQLSITQRTSWELYSVLRLPVQLFCNNLALYSTRMDLKFNDISSENLVRIPYRIIFPKADSSSRILTEQNLG